MADRVLRTILTGRDELTAVLTKAAAETRAFEKSVENANAQSARSSTVAAQVHRAATTGIVSATKEAQRTVAGMGDDFEREGTRAGGLLAQGVRTGLMRNSALTAGAPLLLGAAGVLFGVLGTVAAAQSDNVQSAWVGTWGVIKSEAIDAAHVLEPTLIGVAARVAERFKELGPDFAAGFADAAPLIDEFADSVLDATENALPGMFRAVERGQPVIEGLGDLLESIGTGLSDMFDAMSDHSDAAGKVFTELGQSMEQLLPLLGELLGQGAELAADVLPGLTGTLGLLLSVTRELGPTLPIIIAGFSALRIGRSLAGGLEGLATSLGNAAKNGGAFAGVAGRIAPSVAGIATNAGIAGSAIGFMAAEAYAWTEAGRQAEEVAIRLGRAFEVGGAQAEGASGFIDRFKGLNSLLSTGIGETVGNIQFLGYSFADLIPDTEQATTSYNDWLRGLSRGDQATELVRVATEQLSTAVAEHGPASDQAATAVDNLKNAQAAAAAVADAEAMAIRGVTDAMLAQSDAVLAATNSEYAHRVAAEAADDAFNAMNDAIAEHGRNSEEASDAALQFEGSLLRVVSAAGQMAEDALPANLDANEKLALSQLAQLDQLHALADQYGDALPGSLRTMIAELERSTAGYDRAKLEADALAEGTKTAQSALEGLGAINAQPTIDADDKMLNQKTDGALERLRNLNAQRSTPVIDADDKLMKVKQLGALAGLHQIAAQRPTPPINANDAPITGVLGKTMGALNNVDRQRPNPLITAQDNASSVVRTVLNLINSVPPSRSTTITTVMRTVYETVGSIPFFPGGATGGAVEDILNRVPRYDGGGAIHGQGGPTDDRVLIRASPGEHMLDARDVDLMGGQSAVYAFRAALNAGRASAAPQPATAMPGYSAPFGGTSSQGTAVLEKRTQISVDATGYNDQAIARAIVKGQREDDFLRG